MCNALAADNYMNNSYTSVSFLLFHYRHLDFYAGEVHVLRITLPMALLCKIVIAVGNIRIHHGVD